MPIRINLKEIFPADSQEITVDKLNFNFNKLLELGIGEEGPIGTAGPVGAIGPIGIQGDQGERGNYWYVDSGDPNLLTFTDLVNGDLYLDSVQLAIWQWDETGSTWNFVADISLIINNYLSASPSPFRRGLGIGSAEDNRFIIFNRRDDGSDIVPQSPAQNDILFLNNFDEDTISGFNFGPANPNTPPQISTDSLFNSLLAIYTNEAPIGRFHLNLGTLYSDSGDLKLTDVFQNLKVRYSREVTSITPGLDNYTLTSFNLDLPEFSQSPSNRTANGVFGFTTPKLYPASTINESTRTFIGSSYGLDEIVGVSGEIKTDGLLYIDETSQIYANLGLALNFTIPTIGTSPANYFMLDGSSTIDRLLLNKNTIINGKLAVGNNSSLSGFNIAEFSGESAGEPTTRINIRTHELDGVAPSTAVIQFLPSRLQSNNTPGTLGSRRGAVGFWGNHLVIGTGDNSSNLGLVLSTGASTNFAPTGINSATRMFISQTSGNVGINTGIAEPQGKLHINTFNANNNAIRLEASNQTGITYGIGIISGTSGLSIHDNFANQHRLTIATDGNVGIGTTSPLSPLHVQGGGTVTSPPPILTAWNGTHTPGIRIGSQASGLNIVNPTSAILFGAVHFTNILSAGKLLASARVSLGSVLVPTDSRSFTVYGKHIIERQPDTSWGQTAADPTLQIGNGAGLFQDTNNTLGVATGGQERIKINADGGVQMVNSTISNIFGLSLPGSLPGSDPDWVSWNTITAANHDRIIYVKTNRFVNSINRGGISVRIRVGGVDIYEELKGYGTSDEIAPGFRYTVLMWNYSFILPANQTAEFAYRREASFRIVDGLGNTIYNISAARFGK